MTKTSEYEGEVRDCRGQLITIGCTVVRPSGMRDGALGEYKVKHIKARPMLAGTDREWPWILVWAGTWMRPDQCAVVT